MVRHKRPTVETAEARIERLRHLTVSREVVELLESDFSHERESAFLLFRNESTGVVDLVVRSAQPTTKRSFGFPKDQIPYYADVLGREGYTLVGTYHSHTDTDEEISERRGWDFYGPRKAEYDPILLSPDDQYSFDDEGNLDQIKLLGHKSGRLGFRMRGFIPVNAGGYQRERSTEDVRFLIDNLPVLRERGLLARHYRDGIDNMALELSVVETGVDPTGASILGKHPPYVTERFFPIAAEHVEALRGRYGFMDVAPEEGGLQLSVRSYATGRAEADVLASARRLLRVGCEHGELTRLESAREGAIHVLPVRPDDTDFIRQHMPKAVSALLLEQS